MTRSRGGRWVLGLLLLLLGLVIGVAGLRRRVRLAPVLRRCTVAGAALRGSELTVRFHPDPGVWPT